MADKQRFFAEACRVLEPGGRLVVCAWLARDDPRPWEVRWLLEPICREGRLPSMGDEARLPSSRASRGPRRSRLRGPQRPGPADLVALRAAGRWQARDRPRYRRFLLDRGAADRVFALTLLRLLLAYRTGLDALRPHAARAAGHADRRMTSAGSVLGSRQATKPEDRLMPELRTNLTINPQRLWDQLMETAQFGGTAKGGIKRLTLTDEDKQVRDWFKAQCEALGCTVTVD